MMMHVVYDIKINEPIHGSWLFFGYDVANPQDIYVVANFVEIRAGYGLNAPLRDELVKQLLSFTSQYAKEVGAKGFILKPLTYGLVPDFDKQLPTKEMKIQKVGGFFAPNQEDNASTTEERYYLDALNINRFYVHEGDKICEAEPSVFESSTP